MSCVLINQYSTRLFVSYSVKNQTNENKAYSLVILPLNPGQRKFYNH